MLIVSLPRRAGATRQALLRGGLDHLKTSVKVLQADGGGDSVYSRQRGIGMAIALSAPRSPTHSVSPAGSMAVGCLRPSSNVVTAA
jgi:hypothetical protein